MWCGSDGVFSRWDALAALLAARKVLRRALLAPCSQVSVYQAGKPAAKHGSERNKRPPNKRPPKK
eukprot:2485457-Amphidinium_carterae.1